MLLPEPVAPTRATDSPAPTRAVRPSSTGGPSSKANETPSNATSTAVGTGGGSVGRSSSSVEKTPSRRSMDTTDRGISWKRKPRISIGTASRLNRAIERTTSPTDAEPWSTSQEPRSNTTRIPRFGRA